MGRADNVHDVEGPPSPLTCPLGDQFNQHLNRLLLLNALHCIAPQKANAIQNTAKTWCGTLHCTTA